jgi:hypothetical protein
MMTKVRGNLKFFEEKNNESLTAAKAHFGEWFLYRQLRMVLEHLKANGVESSNSRGFSSTTSSMENTTPAKGNHPGTCVQPSG